MQVAVMCEIAEACLRANPRERPSMLDVIRTLSAVSNYIDSSRTLTYSASSQPTSLAAFQATSINAHAAAASPAQPANAAAAAAVLRPPRSPALSPPQNENGSSSGAPAAVAAASSPGPREGRPSSSHSDGAEARAASMISLGTRLRSSGKRLRAVGHIEWETWRIVSG